MTEPLDSAPPAAPAEVPTAGTGARRAGLLAGGLGVAALAGALAAYLTAGRPYGVNVAGGVLYVGGLGIALVASVLLWIAWGERDPRWAPGRVRAGVATATAALVLTCACTVVSLAHVASGEAQLAMMGVTAAALALALLVARR